MKSLDDLIKSCREQTEIYKLRQKYDPTACFEIWRRAIVDKDELAWVALMEQYGSSALNWVRQCFRSYGAQAYDYEEEALLNAAFFNLFRSLTPEKFSRFTDLPALLQYLKTCCWSVVTDSLRDKKARERDIPLPGSQDDDAGESKPSVELAGSDDAEEMVLDKLQRADFWEYVWKVLDDPADRWVVTLLFIMDMPPREISQQFPKQFPSVDEVYQRRKNILWRLKRRLRREEAS